MRSYQILPLFPFALAATPVVDPFFEMCGVSVTLSATTNTLLLPPQTISICENSNCPIPTFANGGFGPASGQPQQTGGQGPGVNSPAANSAAQPPSATQSLGGNPPTVPTPASQAPGGGSSSPAGSPGGSGAKSSVATASSIVSSGKPTAVTTSSASRPFGAQWDECLVMGLTSLAVLVSLGLGF
ncbi:hypothetical protein CNYM01_01113 [Colletotrichum nymphaeae SA-01]|uniref:GPI anchored serine-rich protein n=1 Tax=Colletotrichum nymphaeae SA-01 TaxID=1460502 RepID=A0A135SEG6_9PEZI|nr:hypothetical protein CNYM01_01113 [Colletotrichum nymphaeae SA-01]